MAQVEFIRNRILAILYARKPHGLRDEELLLELSRELCPITINELASELVYLRDKGLVALDPKLIRGKQVFVSHLTALGRDVLEGNAPAPAGVMVL